MCPNEPLLNRISLVRHGDVIHRGHWQRLTTPSTSTVPRQAHLRGLWTRRFLLGSPLPTAESRMNRVFCTRTHRDLSAPSTGDEDGMNAWRGGRRLGAVTGDGEPT